MRALLDVNVLVALLDHENLNNSTAYLWLAAHAAAGWATSPLTENGCLRILTNPRYPRPLPAREVLAKLIEAKHSTDHVFWPDDLSITDGNFFDEAYLQGHQQITDIYLLALAVAKGGRLTTFDQRIPYRAVMGCRPEHLVVL